MQLDTLKLLFQEHKESALFHRYITTDSIGHLIEKLPPICNSEVIGDSVKGENIYAITIGSGVKKVLMWSQMHGNESTTTKAIFDLLNVLCKESELSKNILDACIIKIIPILNPDGARAYTRLNTNEVDLNRDAQDLSQPESIVLRKCFDVFQPDYCFNLHGQRTIFGTASTGKPATVSFLAPAQDKSCTVTETRKVAMDIIVAMESVLKQSLPNQIGIYDDAFNLNCVGDTFQSLHVPTVLFEAGHYKNDYPREIVREYIFQSLLVSLDYIATTIISGENYSLYFDIPENTKNYFDIIIRNARVDDKDDLVDIAVQFEEKLLDNYINFIPKVTKISKLNQYCGHREINAKGSLVTALDGSPIKVEYENDFVLLNNEELSLKLVKS